MDAVLYMTLLIGCFQPPQRRTSFFNHSWTPYNFALSQKSPCRSLGWVIPAACIAHCPLVSSPPPSGSPAAAGCFAGALGCSHRLWTGCLPCSARTGMPSKFNEGHLKQKRLCTCCKYMLQRRRLGCLLLRSWCCPYCSLGWSWKAWQSSCWSCLSAASPLIESLIRDTSEKEKKKKTLEIKQQLRFCLSF